MRRSWPIAGSTAAGASPRDGCGPIQVLVLLPIGRNRPSMTILPTSRLAASVSANCISLGT